MVTIRKYEAKDKENLRKICVATSGLSTKSEKDLNFLYYMYNDYYAEREPDACFVVANDKDEAVGYILGAKDFDAYYETLSKYYLPKIKQLGLKYYIMAVSEIFVHKRQKKLYPAHLHIDILPEYQNCGAGSRLVSELKAYLKSCGISGICLSVGAANKGAVRFYKKNGFKVIHNSLGSKIMGCNLN